MKGTNTNRSTLTRVQPEIIVHRFTTLVSRTRPDLMNDPAGSSEFHSAPKDDEKPRQSTPFTNPLVVQRQTPRRRKCLSSYLLGRFSFDSSDQVSYFRAQCPSWLSQRSWDLQCSKSSGSWQFTVRTYNVRPCCSNVFYIANLGSPEELQRMFQMRLASPFDCDENGYTLLHVSENMFYKHNIETDASC